MTTTASTPKGERRKAEILAAAVDLMYDDGIDAVRHRAVAQRAEVPLSSISYYFASLEDLVLAAVEQLTTGELRAGWDRLASLPGDPLRDDEQVDLLLHVLLGPVQDDPEADKDAIMLRYERLVSARRRPYLQPLMQQLTAQLWQLLTTISARSDGLVTSDDLERLVVLADGAAVNALIAADADPRAAASGMLTTELARLRAVHGHSPTGA